MNNWVYALIGSQFHDNIYPDVYLDSVNDLVGNGIFTRQVLPAYTYLGEYTGVVKKCPLFSRAASDYGFRYMQSLLSRYVIDADSKGSYIRYINHSTHKNCMSRWFICPKGIYHIIFFTVRRVQANEQLLYDYGDKYWHRRMKPEPLLSR